MDVDRAGAASIARDVAGLASGENLRLGLEHLEGNRLIGQCTLFNRSAICRRAEIGYALASSAWGQGYMNEALKALVRYGFEQLDLNRIEADVDPRNVASTAVLERLGFEREGLLRERWIVSGEVSDSALYGLLRKRLESLTYFYRGDESKSEHLAVGGVDADREVRVRCHCVGRIGELDAEDRGRSPDDEDAGADAVLQSRPSRHACRDRNGRRRGRCRRRCCCRPGSRRRRVGSAVRHTQLDVARPLSATPGSRPFGTPRTPCGRREDRTG